jgi:hypothetical protein
MKLTGLAKVPQKSVSHNPDIKKWVMLCQGDLPYRANFSQVRFAPGQVASKHHPIHLPAAPAETPDQSPLPQVDR